MGGRGTGGQGVLRCLPAPPSAPCAPALSAHTLPPGSFLAVCWSPRRQNLETYHHMGPLHTGPSSLPEPSVPAPLVGAGLGEPALLCSCFPPSLLLW